jgi:DNA-binding CsgD family transcriptional regulator
MIDTVELWERGEVLDAVERLLDRTRAGRGGALFVVGGAGLGKTTCLNQARSLAAEDHVIGVGRGDVMESGLPFGLISQALDALGEPHVLGDVESEEGLTGVGAVRASRFYRVLRRARDVVTPVLLCADDLHWADQDSLALLAFLCRRIGELPVAVVATLRPFPPMAMQVSEALGHDGLAQVEVLAPLSRRSAGELLTVRAGRPVEDRQVLAAWKLASGNPLLLEQLARAAERGEDLEESEIAAASGGLLLSRFAGLPSNGLRLARAASVLGVRFPAELATVVAGLRNTEADQAVEALCRSGLVVTPGGVLEFAHPLFQQALYDELPPPVRARLHTAAFKTLHARGQDIAAAEHAVRADLVGDPAVITVLRRAGAAALRAGALATGVDNLQAAVRLAGDQADPALLLALGEALLTTARSAATVEICEKLRDDPTVTADTRAAALRLLGRAHTSMGAYRVAAARFAEAVELCADSDPPAAIEVLLDEAMASWVVTGPAKALPLAARARDLGRHANPALRRRTAVTWTFIATLTGDGSGIPAADDSYAELAADPQALASELAWAWGTTTVYGHLLSFIERSEEAEQVISHAAATAERLGAIDAFAGLILIRGYLCQRQGLLEEALGQLHRAAELTELVPMIKSFVDAGSFAVLSELNRTAEADAAYQRIRARGESGEVAEQLIGRSVEARRLLEAGAVSEAAAMFAGVEQLCERSGFRDPCGWYWARDAITTYVTLGQYKDARRVISWLESSRGRLPCRWPRIAAACGKAALAAEAADDLELAEGHYQAALSEHEQVTLPMEHIETLLAYGRFLRRRQPARARPVLADALARAEDLGAVRLATRAGEELRAAGGRRRRRDSAELTGQETRVARLAAAGLSNHDVAVALSVTVRTVEYHLGNVYTKLGLRSRRELIMRAEQLGIGAD